MAKWNVLVTLAFIFAALDSWAGAAITYHGRILDSANRPLERSEVLFRIRIYSPDPKKCLLYEETRVLNMTSSSGVFVIPIGDDQGKRSSADPGIAIERIFLNDGSISFSTASNPKFKCQSGTSYTPEALDQRQLQMSFNDFSGSGEQVLTPMELTFAPLAVNSYNAQNVGGAPAGSIVRVDGTTIAPLSANQYNALLALLGGQDHKTEEPPSSSEFEEKDPLVKSFAKNDLPLCSENQFLKNNGQGGLICSSPESSGGALPALSGDVNMSAGTVLTTVVGLQGRTVAATAPINGQVLKWNGTVWAPGADSNDSGVTSVTAGTGLTGGTITSIGTLGLATSGVAAGTYRSVTVDTYGRVTSATNPTTLAGYGVTLNSGQMFVGNASNAVTAVTMSGDGAVSNTGVLSVTGLHGRSLAATAPTNGQVLKWNGTAWTPGADSNDSGVTSVIAGTGLTGGTITSTGTLGLETSGVAAGTYRSVTVDTYGRVTSATNPTTLAGYGVTLNSGQMFVGNASNAAAAVTMSGDATMTNAGALSVTGLRGRTVAATAPTNGQVLKWNGSAWTPGADSNDSGVTTVIAGTGLTGGTITSTGTLGLATSGVAAGTYRSVTVDTYGRVTSATNPTTLAGYGVTLNSGQMFVGNASNAAAAVTMSGDATMTNAGALSVTGLRGRTVAATAPTNGQVLKWNGTAWAPGVDSNDSGVTSVIAGTGLTGGTITSTGTVAIASGGVASGHLAANAVTAAKVASGTLTADKNNVTTCNASNSGMTRYSSSTLQYCNGSAWVAVGGGANCGTRQHMEVWVDSTAISTSIRVYATSCTSGASYYMKQCQNGTIRGLLAQLTDNSNCGQ